VTIYPHAVLFDMDGTLINTLPLWRVIDREILAAHGCVVPDEVINGGLMYLTGSVQGIARYRQYLVDAVNAPLTVDRYAELSDQLMARHLRSGVNWMPGAQALLFDVCSRGIPAALVTTSPRMLVDAWFTTHEENPFSAVVTGDEVTHGKPHPEPYLKAAAMLGVDPRKCVAIEDTVSGYTSACAAGCGALLASSHPHDVSNRVPTLAGVTVDDLRVLRATHR
jgi:HAD superfamily hydrolase (TIGR01509 family)